MLGLVALVIVLVLLALANLDARPMKGWVRGAAQGQGIALDYDAGRVTLGGLRFAKIQIASPSQDTVIAPQLISVAAIEGRWSLLSKRVDELVIRDVALTVVRDADGTTSLDRWLAAMPPSTTPAEPSEPLSALASSLVPPGVEAHARIEGVTLTVIDRDGQGVVVNRMVLTGLTAKLDVADGGVAVALGPAPLRLVIEPVVAEAGAATAGKREAVIDLSAALKLGANGHGEVSLGAVLQRQSFAPVLPPLKDLVSLGATLDFVPKDKRTLVRVQKLRLLDGAATLTADVRAEDVVIAGAPGIRPVIEQLALRVDLPAIARAVPPELGPLEAEGEPIVVTVKDAAVAPSPQGTLAASGTLARVRYKAVAIRALRLGVDAAPVGRDGARGELRVAVGELAMPDLTVRDVEVTVGGDHPASAATAVALGMWPVAATARATVGAVETPEQRVQGVVVTAKANARSATALDAELTADVASVEVAGPPPVGKVRRAPSPAMSVQGVHVEVAARDIALGAVPMASTGTLRVQGTVAGARDATGLRAKAVAFSADAALAQNAAARATVKLDAEQLVVPGLGVQLGPSFAGGPVHAELEAPEIALVMADPARSRGKAQLAARYGGATVEGTASGSADEVAWDLNVRAPRLGPSRNVVVGSRGTLRPATTQIAHDTQIQVGPTTLPDAALRGAKVHLVSSGTLQKHEAKISVAVDAPTSGGKAFPSAKLDIAAKADLGRGAVDVHLKGVEPAADLHLIASLDAKRSIQWQAKGKLSGLAAAAVMLPPGPDWSRLALEIDGRGVASGIVARMDAGMPVLVADPATALRGHQALKVTVRDVHYEDAALTRADVDVVTLQAEVDLGASRKASVSLDVPAFAAVSSGVKLGAKALAVRLDATLGGQGVVRAVDAKLSVRAASATQSAAPWYEVADPTIEVTVTGDPEATMAVAMHVANPGGGTAFDASGDLERGRVTPGAGVVARNSLALEGTVVQTLDRLDAAPGKLKARGAVRVPFRVESGDLSLFRAVARIALDHVAVELPEAKVRVAEINGELPILQEVVLGPGGVELVGQGERGPFSQLRFPDYRPFVGAADYLTIGEIEVKGRALGPVAGNMRVDHDVVALDQLELAALGGKITGQFLGQWRGIDSQVVFRGKITGLRAPVPGKPANAGEPLDANLAITLTPYRYGLEGRAELVRISRDHLRALLDVWDPYRADVAANRVRLALLAGFPKQVRLRFASGFAALAVELGGLAGVVRIDELTGLPIGPALAFWLAPLLEH